MKVIFMWHNDDMVDIINDTEKEREAYEGYGCETFYITKEQLKELSDGKIIAIHINGGEYGAFIKLKES